MKTFISPRQRRIASGQYRAVAVEERLDLVGDVGLEFMDRFRIDDLFPIPPRHVKDIMDWLPNGASYS